MNPPASQQPARPAKLAASEPSRVLGEGSDAAETRVAAYAEAIRCAVAPLSEETTAEDWLEEARAVMAVADAEQAELRAEIERLKRGGAELGRILDRTLRDALDASGRHDVIEEDGDGDWALVWETLAELRPRAEAAEAEVERLRDLAQRNFKQGAALLGELQAAERARDAALAEVTGLRDRLGRVGQTLVEVIGNFAYPTHPGRACKQSGNVPVETIARWQDVAALASPAADREPFFRDKVTGEPCPRRGNVLCTLPYSPDHRHVAAHMWDTGAASPTEQATEGGAK